MKKGEGVEAASLIVSKSQVMQTSTDRIGYILSAHPDMPSTSSWFPCTNPLKNVDGKTMCLIGPGYVLCRRYEGRGLWIAEATRKVRASIDIPLTRLLALYYA